MAHPEHRQVDLLPVLEEIRTQLKIVVMKIDSAPAAEPQPAASPAMSSLVKQLRATEAHSARLHDALTDVVAQIKHTPFPCHEFCNTCKDVAEYEALLKESALEQQ